MPQSPVRDSMVTAAERLNTTPRGSSRQRVLSSDVAGPVPLSRRLLEHQTNGKHQYAAQAFQMLIHDLNLLSLQVLEIWQKFLLCASLHCFTAVVDMFQSAWQTQLALHWSESVYQEVVPVCQLAFPEDSQVWAVHA